MVWDAPESLPVYQLFPALSLPLQVAELYSPLIHVTKDDAPPLIIMGGKDQIVPVIHGRKIDEAFQKEGVEHKLIIFPEGTHALTNPNITKQISNETIAWFNRYLLKHK